MNRLRNLPIQRKLLLVILLTCSAMLVLALASLFAVQSINIQSNFIRDLTVSGRIIAHHCVAAAAFNDRDAALEALSGLQDRTEIEGACLVLGNGEHVTRFPKDGERGGHDALMEETLDQGYRFIGPKVLFASPVLLDGKRMGTLYLRADFRPARASLLLLSGITLAVVLVLSLVLALALSSRLQRFITAPVLHLAETVRDVTGKGDYSLRCTRAGDDEIGALTDAFNEMLEQIQQRDARLVERTQELAGLVSLLNATLNSTADGIMAEQPFGQVLCMNSQFATMWGFPEGVLSSEDNNTMIESLAGKVHDPESYLRRIQEFRASSMLDGFDVIELKDGTVLDRYSAPVLDQDGTNYGRIWTFRDITERKKAETRLRRLVDSNIQGVFFWNTQGEITDANDAFLRIVRYSREDLAAGLLKWSALTPPEHAEADQRALKECAITGFCASYEKELLRKDGRPVPILIGAAAFADNPNEGVCFVLDLTEHKKLEGQFRQSQKMDAVGQLASGVAHDFNNILAVIQLQADLLKNDETLSPREREVGGEIGDAAQRAGKLTRQLLTFSRQQTPQLCELNLSEAIKNTLNILRRTLGEHIEMQFKPAPEPLFIHADAVMMDQVLLNLAVNARDAMRESGRLVIETSSAEFDEFVVAQSPQARPGSFVCLAVSDTGHGIPPEHLQRIFEPFFTTKEVGKGTGLGLATVFGIVQQHKGWINVYSEVGRGTTFRIYLPRRVRGADLKRAPTAPAGSRGGRETILLVEDESSLRASVRVVLTRLGYRVLEASDGTSALDVWHRHPDDIRLVLTDMVMPGGMSGKMLAEQLMQKNPRLKIIYASGYSREVASMDFPLEEGVNFLAKPFEMSKLANAIRNRLDVASS